MLVLVMVQRVQANAHALTTMQAATAVQPPTAHMPLAVMVVVAIPGHRHAITVLRKRAQVAFVVRLNGLANPA